MSLIVPEKTITTLCQFVQVSCKPAVFRQLFLGSGYLSRFSESWKFVEYSIPACIIMEETESILSSAGLANYNFSWLSHNPLSVYFGMASTSRDC